MRLSIQRVSTIQGEIRPPSDKSLTHRAFMFSAIAKGESRVFDPLKGEDCLSTLRCLNQMGLRHEWVTPREVRLMPSEEWETPKANLDCGNSGTTIRLMSGLVASRPLRATFVGDASLSRRPMKRIAAPLIQMGATVQGDTPPLSIVGGQLAGIDYVSPVASAQVKSCVLLAGLRASGTTSVTEPSMSRDHTERMLSAMGVQLSREVSASGEYRVALSATDSLSAFQITIPGDISSAAFLAVAAAVLPGSSLLLKDLSVNETRTGLLDVFEQVGVGVTILNPREELGEPVADVLLEHKRLSPFTISGALVPRLIDEIPVLAVLATQCEGVSVIRDAKELRVKESDRIELMANGLRAMGAKVETQEDGLTIEGPTPLTATHVDAHGDHRIAMSFAIAGLFAEGTTTIDGAESIATSYPEFQEHLAAVAR